MKNPIASPKRFNLYYLYCDDEKHNVMPEQRLADIQKALLAIYQKKYGGE